MGLLDILNGMQNGPRGQTTPAPAGSGGMSPIAMALLGLVAYKAIKQLSPDQPNAVPANRGTSTAGILPVAALVDCCRVHWAVFSRAALPAAC